MKRFSIIFSMVCFLFFGAYSVNVNAQSKNVTIDDLDSGRVVGVDSYSSPDINIYNLKSDKIEYLSGENVKLSFISQNLSSNFVSDISYKISLIDIGTDGSERVYDEKWQDGSTISANQSLSINLSYQLPKEVFVNNLTIRVQAYLSDETATGYGDLNIKESGKIGSQVKIGKASIFVSDKEYKLEDGPTIDKGAQPILKLEISSDSSINVFPSIETVSKQDFKRVISTESGDSISVNQNKRMVSIRLPSFDKAGTYIGSVILRDSNLKQLSDIIKFRYIISGNQGDIINIISENSSVSEGGILPVSVTYGGAPFDITTLNNFSTNAKLSIEVINEKGMVVGKDTKDIKLTSAQDTVVFNLIAKNDATALRATVKLYSGDNVLSVKTTDLTENFDKFSSNNTIFYSNEFMLIVIGLLILFMIILVIVTGVIKKNNIIPIIILFLGLIGAEGVFINNHYETKMVFADNATLIKTITSNTPLKIGVSASMPSAALPGGTLNVKGGIFYTMCNNTASDPIISVTLRKEGSDVILDKRIFNPSAILALDDNHDKATRSNKFNTKNTKNGDLKIPNEAGNYTVMVNAIVTVTNLGVGLNASAWTKKVYKVVVTDNDLCPDPGVQNTLPCPNSDNNNNHDKDVINCNEDIWVENGLENSCKEIGADGVGKQYSTWSLTAPGAYDCPVVSTDHGIKWRPCTVDADGTINTLCDFVDSNGKCLPPKITSFKGIPELTSSEKGCDLRWNIENSSSCKITKEYIGEDKGCDNKDTNEVEGCKSDEIFPYMFNVGSDGKSNSNKESESIGASAKFTMECISGELKTIKQTQCRLQRVNEQ